MAETSASASAALRSGNRVVVWGIAAIVVILALAALLLFISLPDANGDAVNEVATGSFVGNPLDNDLTETTWCALSWPINYGNSGNRAFFVNQTGDIVSADNAQYSQGAFFAGSAMIGPTGANLARMTGLLAVGTVSRDGNMWRQVN